LSLELPRHISPRAMNDRDPATNDAIVVRTKGMTAADWIIQAAILISIPVAVLFVIYLSGPKPPVDVEPRFVGIVIMLAALDLLFEEIVSVRQVRLDQSGVTFRFLVHSERRSWRDLRPSMLVPKRGDWGVTSNSRDGKPTIFRGYRLTLPQAQALIRHPSCPAWELPEPVRRWLGLTPHGPANGR
jgi:hypothetical protein